MNEDYFINYFEADIDSSWHWKVEGWQ